MDIAQFYIGFIDHQFSFWETHGRGAIAAATTLMEHKLAMSFPELVNDLHGPFGDQNPFYQSAHFRKSPICSCRKKSTCSWSVCNDSASFYGFPYRFLTFYIRQMGRVQDRHGSS